MLRHRWRTRIVLGSLVLFTVILYQEPSRGQADTAGVAVQLSQVPGLTEIWPADFNEDGITDLVASAGTTVVVEIGHGDGTFDPARTVAVPASTVAGVGDLNHDGFIDILTASTAPASYVLPGRGDGTFGAAIILPVRLVAPTYVVDMDNDGHADLVTLVGAPGGALVHQGLGDFTFGTTTTLRISSGLPAALTIADLNGDGLLDVVVNTLASRLDVYINTGSLNFSGSSIALPLSGGGVTARDLNGDGVIDLAVGVGLERGFASRPAFVYLFLGNGDGTFTTPAVYPVLPGPVMVVSGDFNGDGIPDIASANRSSVDACDSVDNLWDSVSILLGRGDGTLAPAQSFALGDSENFPDNAYRRSVTRLNTSDLNADGRTDLLVSRGAILLMQPAVGNRPPIADAGPDRTDVQGPFFDDKELRGAAADPDADWLTFEWRDDLGHVIGALAQQCHIPQQSGTRIYTLTVTDSHGGVSSDSMQLTVAPFFTPPPTGFSSSNIGNVSGSFDAYSSNADRFNVTGSGADIWDTSDAFHYVYTSLAGDFDVSAQVASLENIDPWTKAGLMIRQSLSPSSRHASIFATPTAVNGTAFQRRTIDGGASTHTSGPSVAPAVWLRLSRQGDTITAFTRVATTDPWTMVGTETLSGLADPVHVGMAVTSHNANSPARAFFDHFSLVPLNSPLPPGWEDADVGSVAAAGGASGSGGAFTVAGSGADIWDTRDAFHFTFRRLPGDGIAMVHVNNLAGPNEWSKAGLMIRQSLDPSAPHHFLLSSEAHGGAYQRRPTAGAATLHTGILGNWFLIQRSGGTLHLWVSNQVATPTRWDPLPDAAFPTGDALIGLAVTSHADGQLATATFDHVSVTLGATPPALTGSDLGAVGIAGSDSFNGSAYTLSASGADIWDTVDAFRFVYRPLPSNGTIIARVASLGGVDPWSKAGVMIRASTDPSSAHAFMFLSQENGLAFQRRTTAGAITTHTGIDATPPPQWVRLTRVDNVVTAAYSSDGQTWTEVGGDTLPIGSGPVLIGLALTSHDNNALATATFDNVLILP